MEIYVNDNSYTFSGSCVHDLMEDLNLLQKKGIAIALNQSIIPKSDWNNASIKENDSIIIITAAAGG